MAGKLVTKLSNRKCFTLSEKDTLKTASVGIAGSTLGWIEWAPPRFSALGAIATLIYMLIKIYKEIK